MSETIQLSPGLVAAKFQRWIDRAKKEDDRRYFQPRDKIFNKKACS